VARVLKMALRKISWDAEFSAVLFFLFLLPE